MSEKTTKAAGKEIAPPADFEAKAHVKSIEQYQEMYDRSIADPEGFWGEIAETFEWKEKWSKVLDYSFDFEKVEDLYIKWFVDGKTNLSVNCLDRHLETRGDQTAILWEGNTPGDDSKLT